MKNKSGSRTGSVFSRIINIRSWSDWERTKTLSSYLAGSIVKVFVPQKATKSESFEAAIKRLNLTEKDLLVRRRNLLRTSILMLVIAFLLLVYSGYHFFNGHIMGGLLTIVVMLVALVLAFRYHFWYFQIKERKLGCSFNEWFKRSIKGDKQ